MTTSNNTIANIINANISEVDFSVFVEMTVLEKMGWDFDHVRDHDKESFEATKDFAESIGREFDEEFEPREYWVQLRATGTPEKFRTTYEVVTYDMYRSRIGAGSDEESGDDEQTMKDIYEIMMSGNHGRYSDMSVDNQEKYFPLFVGIDTMPA